MTGNLPLEPGSVKYNIAQLWGADWVDAFCTNAGVTQRTVARWKQQGFVRRGPVIAMLDAFLKCKRAGLKYGDTILLGAL